VLDDGSKDNTQEVMEKYKGRVIFDSHPNMGEARTVNKGWSMAHGDLIGTVNSDDPLLPGAISTLVAFFKEHPDIVVAYPDWDMIGPDSKLMRHVQTLDYDYVRAVRRQECIPGPGTFFRRKVLELAGLRDTEFKYAGDYEFWLRAGLAGKFARIPKTLATWRSHPQAGTFSHAGPTMAAEHPKLMEKFYKRPGLPPEILRVRAEAMGKAYFDAGAICMVNGYSRPAIKYFWKSVRLCPSLWFKERVWWPGAWHLVSNRFRPHRSNDQI
jgi:glycosyltransferase involved in cell wall biosynthesis